MKKFFCLLLSALLLWCAAACPASAQSLSSSGSAPGSSPGSSPGGSPDDTGTQPEGPWDAEPVAVNPENGVRIGDATATITEASVYSSQVWVTVHYQNDGPGEYSYSDLFWLRLTQGASTLLRDEQSIGILSARRPIAGGDSLDLFLAFDLKDKFTPVEITLESFDEGRAQPYTVWFEPVSGLLGSREAVEEQSARNPDPEGRTDGSIGSGPAPDEENFFDPVFYALRFRDAEGAGGPDVKPVRISSAGQFTVGFESEAELHGIGNLELQILNGTDAPASTRYTLNDHRLRIDRVLVDGQPVLSGKNTTFFWENQDKEGNVTLRWLSAILYCTEKSPGSCGVFRWYWDDDQAQPTTTILDPGDFSAFHSLSVTFSFGKFTLPEPAESSAPAPKPAAFLPLLHFRLCGTDASGNPIEGGTQEIVATTSGRYTLTLEADEPVSGLGQLYLAALNSSDRAMVANHLQRNSFRIDEILVDGSPVTFGDVSHLPMYTYGEDGSPVSRWLAGVLYDPDPDSALKRDSRDTWFRDGADPSAPPAVDPADFGSFRTLSVTFSFGTFETYGE